MFYKDQVLFADFTKKVVNGGAGELLTRDLYAIPRTTKLIWYNEAMREIHNSNDQKSQQDSERSKRVEHPTADVSNDSASATNELSESDHIFIGRLHSISASLVSSSLSVNNNR